MGDQEPIRSSPPCGPTCGRRKPAPSEPLAASPGTCDRSARPGPGWISSPSCITGWRARRSPRRRSWTASGGRARPGARIGAGWRPGRKGVRTGRGRPRTGRLRRGRAWTRWRPPRLVPGRGCGTGCRSRTGCWGSSWTCCRYPSRGWMRWAPLSRSGRRRWWWKARMRSAQRWPRCGPPGRGPCGWYRRKTIRPGRRPGRWQNGGGCRPFTTSSDFRTARAGPAACSATWWW